MPTTGMAAACRASQVCEPMYPVAPVRRIMDWDFALRGAPGAAKGVSVRGAQAPPIDNRYSRPCITERAGTR